VEFEGGILVLFYVDRLGERDGNLLGEEEVDRD
jgi:hypothetical protein